MGRCNNKNLINWGSKVDHLDNILSQKLDDVDDIQRKKCHFIESVNKMFSNFDNLKSAVMFT